MAVGREGPGLLAAVEQVDALDVAWTHLRGRAEGGVAVGKGHHGGEEVVLGEGQSAGGKWSVKHLDQNPAFLCSREVALRPLQTDLS